MAGGNGGKTQTASGRAVEPNDVALSPYVGGGGGTSLGHRIATTYLTDMLLGAGRPETEELPVVRVAFQTNPTDPVDDLRVEAERDGSRVVVHVAARRSPQFTPSHAKTVTLVGSLLDQVDAIAPESRAYVAVAVAGMTGGQKDVQRLASLARDNASEADFHAQVHTPGRHADLANRYKHLSRLVQKARAGTPDDTLRPLVWSLLNRLWVLNFRVEPDDETDWAHIANRLDALARAGKNGADVRDTLHSQASRFDSMGTVVDLGLLRREVHSVLEPAASKLRAAWRQLDAEQESAEVAVRHQLAGTISLPRTSLQTAVQTELALAGTRHEALLIRGESGTGKSALTLSAAGALAEASADFQYVVLNLRRTRASVAALSHDLGTPLTDVLKEMSAPSRILIVDAADAAAEDRGPLLRELVASAKSAGVGVALVSADNGAEEVSSALIGLYPDSRTFEVPGLDDDELRYVREAVPAIAGALRNPPSKSLYRRLMVVDLLARTGTTVDRSLEDWACLELIWNHLIGRAGGASSPAARKATLLAMSEAELRLPKEVRTYPALDHAALDALRSDLLVAPENLRKAEPEFSHEEVRRFATAVRLVRAEQITAVLNAAGAARWSMSAARLACQGKLSSPDGSGGELALLVAEFDAFGDASTVRWKDVPLEAALEMSNAYELLRHLLDSSPSSSGALLSTVIRVATLHHQSEGMVNVQRVEPVVRLLLEEVRDPWSEDDDRFRLLRNWLNSALVNGVSRGNPTRAALRRLLLNHWRAHHPSTPNSEGARQPEAELVRNAFDDYATPARLRRGLEWKITQERYLELFALLGPDIDDDIRACLCLVAAESPSRLQPAVDPDWSALGLGAYDPGLLLQLTEAYFIDTERAGIGLRWDGIRHHQPRGAHRLSSHSNGPFWVITQLCRPDAWVPVVNRILNHAVNIRCRAEDGAGAVARDARFTLAIDGTERTYVGDANVWGWYRGNTSGPYPCMSALQAVERWVDRMVAAGTAMEQITATLLAGCENLAMPALITGATIRHFADPRELDRFVVEPLIWQLELSRTAHESLGFLHAPNDGITNPERRQWHLRDVASLLVASADEPRQDELRNLAEQLIANAARLAISETTARRWAATLDSKNLVTEHVSGGVLVSVKEPKDIEDELAPKRAEMDRGNVLLGIQNKYWIPAIQQKETWRPPAPVEIAEDLVLVRDLHDNPPAFPASDPLLGVAYVAAAAIRSAAEGHPEAFGKHASFAITSILAILEQAAEETRDEEDALQFETDIGTREVAAGAVPHLLLPELTEQITLAEVSQEELNGAASALGRLASTAACLAFARGCDEIWAHSCTGDKCIHVTAYQWSLDLGRLCELGEPDNEFESFSRASITGNLMARVPDIAPDRLDTSRLSATIRAVGRAAASDACIAPTATRDLRTLLLAQARAMSELELSEHLYFVDDDGGETMSAARALLHHQSQGDAGDRLLMEYVTVLTPTPHVFSAFLRDLAAAGAETQELADAARDVWPTLFSHVLDEVEKNSSTYRQADSFVGYALSHLFPAPSPVDATYTEAGRRIFEWVPQEDLVALVPRWLPHAAGRHACLLELIRFLRRLPVETRLGDGLDWLDAMCLSRPGRYLVTSEPMNDWLVEIKTQADARGAGARWLKLVDRLVHAGNTSLAAYSR